MTGPSEYLTLVRVTVETETLTRSIAGTLFAGSRPRIVEIKGIKVEADFAPHMLYVTNQDRPGFIGRFGATLAGAGINIATFHLGRASQGGDAICLVSVDERVPEAVLDDGAHPAAGGAGGVAVVLRRCPRRRLPPQFGWALPGTGLEPPGWGGGREQRRRMLGNRFATGPVDTARRGAGV